EVFKNTLRALLIGVFLYPVIGLGGCITRLIVQGSPPNPMTQTQAHDTWLYSPLKAWTTEAIVIPLLIVAITFFVGLIKLNQISPVVKVLLLLLGVAAAIYSGGALINSVRRTRTAAAPVNNSSQAGVVGTMREVNTTNLNMRSGPGANYPVVATFPKKARIVSYGETRNVDGELWTQAATPDGRIRGWVNRKFLSP
ncbi:MAG TPA: SH3 domain-containing protein, partial [Pyrinomonadaceae bacterium]